VFETTLVSPASPLDSGCLLLSAYCLLPTPTAYCLPLTAYCLLPTPTAFRLVALKPLL